MKIGSKLVMGFVPLLLATAAEAAPITFAQFDLGSNLTYTDTGATSMLSESSGVLLTCLDPECAGVGPDATLTLSAVVSGTAFTGDLFGFPFVDQPLGPGTLTVTLDTPFDGKTNFLTLDFSAASISGFEDTPDATIDSSGASTFSSDFLAYTDVGFQLLTDADPTLGVDGSGYLDSFAGDATSGSFFGTPGAIPEPSSLALLGAALAGLGSLRRRKKAA